MVILEDLHTPSNCRLTHNASHVEIKIKGGTALIAGIPPYSFKSTEWYLLYLKNLNSLQSKAVFF